MTEATSNKSIPVLPGLDLSAALHRVGNNWALLQNILFIFLRSHHSTFQQFLTATSTSDWATAVRIAHTVKGSSATIGAMNLSQVAGEVEDCLKMGRQQEATLLHAKFQIAFEEALSSVEKLKAEQDSTPQNNSAAEPSTKQELLQLTDDLIRNLTDDLSKAEEQIKRFSGISQHHYTDSHFCTELTFAFEHFNFQKVKSLLNQFRQTLMNRPE